MPRTDRTKCADRFCQHLRTPRGSPGSEITARIKGVRCICSLAQASEQATTTLLRPPGENKP
jgi:hypothetical protein